MGEEVDVGIVHPTVGLLQRCLDDSLIFVPLFFRVTRSGNVLPFLNVWIHIVIHLVFLYKRQASVRQTQPMLGEWKGNFLKTVTLALPLWLPNVVGFHLGTDATW